MAIKVNTQAVAQTAVQLRSGQRGTAGAYDGYNGAISRLRRSWSGTAADAAQQALAGNRQYVHRWDTETEEFARFLTTSVAQGYDDAENARKAAASEFK